jgi:hypothetical protein
VKEESAESASAEKAEESKEANANDQEGEGDQQNQTLDNTASGFDNTSGAFPNMNFGAGNFDQMQMMMAMQNGMPANAFGTFPMMGSFIPAIKLRRVTHDGQTR